MKLSKCIFKTQKNISNLDKATDRLIRGGFIQKECSGIFRFTNFGVRILNNIKLIITEELNKIDCFEVALPILQDSSIWAKSGRIEAYGPEKFSLQDRKKSTMFLAPTAEESATELINNQITSYKQLPINVFQILEKYRDEMRPRFGLIRSRQFTMKDAYSFDKNEKEALETYVKYYNCYLKIFKRLNIDIYPVQSDAGQIGGALTHEFVAINTSIGEGDLFYDELINSEVKNIEDIKLQCSFENKNYSKSIKCIELGQIYFLGDKYSTSMKALYNNELGIKTPFSMGCYGIGVTRTLSYLAEQFPYYPLNVTPFKYHIIGVDINKSNELYDLINDNKNILYDDRDIGFGTKKHDAELIGIPYQIIIGEKIEFINFLENKITEFKTINDLAIYTKTL